MELPARLSWYAAVATLFLKHRSAMNDERGDDAQSLANDLERLGPTFIKLGQLLSGRSDLLPPAYAHALSRLQDDLKPFPYADVELIVEAELGVKVSKSVRLVREKPTRRCFAWTGA